MKNNSYTHAYSYTSTNTHSAQQHSEWIETTTTNQSSCHRKATIPRKAFAFSWPFQSIQPLQRMWPGRFDGICRVNSDAKYAIKSVLEVKWNIILEWNDTSVELKVYEILTIGCYSSYWLKKYGKSKFLLHSCGL